MTQPDLEDGVWFHHLWDKDDKDKYPLTEMPSVWCVSDDDDDEEYRTRRVAQGDAKRAKTAE